jgi:phospholipase C
MPLDHTSILKTVEKRWGLPALTARDAAAPDVGDVLTLNTARTDDPLEEVKVPQASGKDPAKGQPSHLQQVHAELVAHLPVQDKHGNRIPPLAELRTSADYKAYIQSRTAAWKKSRKATAEFHTRSAKKRGAKRTTHATRKTKKNS